MTSERFASFNTYLGNKTVVYFYYLNCIVLIKYQKYSKAICFESYTDAVECFYGERSLPIAELSPY